MTTPIPTLTQQIGNLIRYWVHYDNTLARLNKEVKDTRDKRNNYEGQVLQMIRQANMTNPVIQIGGGRVTIGEDKHQTPLSFTAIESMLHQYYAKKPGARDETADIIKFIRSNRESHMTPCLKRQGAARSRSHDGAKDT